MQRPTCLCSGGVLEDKKTGEVGSTTEETHVYAYGSGHVAQMDEVNGRGWAQPWRLGIADYELDVWRYPSRLDGTQVNANNPSPVVCIAHSKAARSARALIHVSDRSEAGHGLTRLDTA